jgi:hypothetical protein
MAALPGRRRKAAKTCTKNLAFRHGSHKMYHIYILHQWATEDKMMIGKAALRLFLLPGNLVSDAVGAGQGEERAMLRSLVNMLVWNLLVVLGVLWGL